MEAESSSSVTISVDESVNMGNYQTRTYRLVITSGMKEPDKEEIKRMFAVIKQAMAEK